MDGAQRRPAALQDDLLLARGQAGAALLAAVARALEGLLLQVHAATLPRPRPRPARASPPRAAGAPSPPPAPPPVPPRAPRCGRRRPPPRRAPGPARGGRG